MIEETDRSRTTRPIVVSILAVAAAGAIAFGVSQVAGGGSGDDRTTTTDSGAAPDADSPKTPTSGGTLGEVVRLAEPLGGQEAIDALGDKLDVVAQRNNMSAQELKDLLLGSDTVRIGRAGFIFYLDTGLKPPTP